MSRIAKPTGPSPKTEPYRKLAYRQHVARKPCMACGYAKPNDEGYCTQAAHIRHGFGGIGIKPDDWFLLSLCAEDANGCHAEFAKDEKAFSLRKFKMKIEELKAHAKALFENWLTWKGQT